MKSNKSQAKADIALKEAEIQELNGKVLTEAERIKVDKLSLLTDMLQSCTIDSERTLIGSEPCFIPVFNEGEQLTIKAKVFELISKL
jgi:hypothetical protein